MLNRLLSLSIWHYVPTANTKKILSIDQMDKLALYIKNMEHEHLHYYVEQLVADNYDLNVLHHKYKYSFIHLAIRHGQFDNQQEVMKILEILIKAGVDINQAAGDSLKATPLHTATRRGLPSLVTWLLSHGANPALLDQKHKTSLNYVQEILQNSKEDRGRIVEISDILNNRTNINIFSR